MLYVLLKKKKKKEKKRKEKKKKKLDGSMREGLIPFFVH